MLQDLEGEAVQLRSRKRPVTDRAQMLLQVLSVSDTPHPHPAWSYVYPPPPPTLQILMEFMHHKNEGLPLDILTTSSVSIQTVPLYIAYNIIILLTSHWSLNIILYCCT